MRQRMLNPASLTIAILLSAAAILVTLVGTVTRADAGRYVSAAAQQTSQLRPQCPASPSCYNNGRWHDWVSTYEEVDDGVVSLTANGGCWVAQDVIESAYWGVLHQIDCSLFERPPGGSWTYVNGWDPSQIWYPNGSGYYPEFTGGAAATWNSPTYSTTSGTTWELEVIPSYSGIWELYKSIKATLEDSPGGYMVVDATCC